MWGGHEVEGISSVIVLGKTQRGGGKKERVPEKGIFGILEKESESWKNVS